MEIPDLVEKIRKKKELSGISEVLITESVKKYLEKNRLDIYAIGEKESKILVKEIRNELRKYSGRFQGNSKDRINLLKENKFDELLSTHSSTRERIDAYSDLKEKIKDLNIKSILDLGCGLNPLALAEGYEYYASDIKEDELAIINEYFKIKKIHGNVFFRDLRKISDLPHADLCLMLKVFDVIETKGHKLAEKIIKNINCKYMIVSFSTKTLSGKPMNHPQRGWIERLLQRLGHSFTTFSSKNEIFYLVKLSPQ